MATEPDSLTGLEDAIVDRLKAALADISPKVHVLVSAELAAVEEEKQLVPAVHVLYGGIDPIPKANRPDGMVLGLEQTWLMVVATRNVADPKQGRAARKAAGVLAAQAAKALMGAKLPSSTGPMVLSGGMAPGFNKGFMYLPLVFKVPMVLSAR